MRHKSGDLSERRLALAIIFFEAAFSCKRKKAEGLADTPQAISVRRQIKFEAMTKQHPPPTTESRNCPYAFGSRHLTKFTIFRLISTSRFWLRTSIKVRTMPRSGRDSERRASKTVARTESSSPGKTGLSQRNSSPPGDPRLATLER